MAVTTISKKESVEQFIERVFNGRDYDAAAEYFAHDVVQHAPDGRTVEGIDAVVEDMERYHTAFSDLEATIEECVEEGDLLVTRFTYRGTHDGEFAGIEPTGERAEVSGMTMSRFEGEKVAESWVVVDMLGVLQQVGAFPGR